MENASKALIIAAAILISILLITMGVYIVGTAQEQMKNSGLDEVGVTTFNQKFEQYQGKQKGSEIRTMVQLVMANNNGDEASDETMVSINKDNSTAIVYLEGAADKQPSYSSSFKNTKTYNVSFEYSKGRVSNIKVTE